MRLCLRNPLPVVAKPEMTRTAVIYRWNSLRRQYKSESPFGNPLFPRCRVPESGGLRDGFLRRDRLVQVRLGRRGLEEASGTRQQKVERRNTLSDIETSATGDQKQEREEGRASHNFSGGVHLAVL